MLLGPRLEQGPAVVCAALAPLLVPAASEKILAVFQKVGDVLRAAVTALTRRGGPGKGAGPADMTALLAPVAAIVVAKASDTNARLACVLCCAVLCVVCCV